jgi:hypothetical protein
MSERERRGTKSKATAATLLVVTALSMPAQAQQDVLTLACKGTSTTEDEKPTPVSKGLIVNFTTRTIQGFVSPGLLGLGDYPVNIDWFNDAIVEFSGSKKVPDTKSTYILHGKIDRVTGDVEPSELSVYESETPPKNISTKYSLNCRPAQRMF